MEEKKLFLLDAYALIFRAYYAMIQSPRFSSKGVNTSAIMGFVNTLQDVIKRENPTHMAVCFDPQGPTFRHEAYPEYKAQRDATPEGIREAVPHIKQILEAYNIPVIDAPGFEADDVIGTLAHKAEAAGFDAYMVTPDKDFGQLVSDHVKQYRPGVKGGEYELRDVEFVCNKYGLKSPLQVIDLLALMGDAADNIPGCPGVGEKTAVKLLQDFPTIEDLLANTDKLKGALQKKVVENAEKIRFSKFLTTIRTDVPVDFDEELLRRRPANLPALRAIFEELDMRSFVKRISNNPTETATAAAAQPSLFDAVDSAETGSGAEPESSRTTLADVPHDFRLMAHGAQALAQAMPRLSTIALALMVDGDEAMTCTLVGYAVATTEDKACYVPADEAGISALKQILACQNLTVVCGDVKFAMVALSRYGIEWSAKYYDTSVAHYLLQPERQHGLDAVAAEMLGYDMIDVAQILGARGKARMTKAQLPPEKLCDFACERAAVAMKLHQKIEQEMKEENLRSLLTDIELPLVKVLADMERVGVRVDETALNEYSQLLTTKMNALEAECYQLAGVQFNTASPLQVGEVLFDKLKIDEKARKTKGGQYSTTEDILVKLVDRHPLVGKILELRGIRKLLTTYVNALPELINPNTGRIHTTYNQTITATGRLSSANPNLQNIPVRSDEGREIRRAFIPAEGNVFFSADYSQIELRLVADLSGDTTMTDAFCHDVDVHALTAARIYHKEIENVTPDERRKAKTANFGILYGISAFGLAERLQIPRSEAKMLIDGYFTTFPRVAEYIEEQKARARENGFVTTLLGRRRMLPDINSRNAVVRGFSERNAVNAPIQGTAADVIKIAMVRIARRFAEQHLQSKMILQVHDELNFDVVPEELNSVKRIVVEEMQGAYHGNVPLTASHGEGNTWLDAH